MMTVGSPSISVGDEGFSGMFKMSGFRPTMRALGHRLTASTHNEYQRDHHDGYDQHRPTFIIQCKSILIVPRIFHCNYS